MTIYKSYKTGREFSTMRGYVNHMRHVYKGMPIEQAYCNDTGTTPPKCKYCDNLCKFISLRKGYDVKCSSKLCEYTHLCIINKTIAKVSSNGICGYDEIILNNIDLFQSAFDGSCIIDPYDGMVHSNTRFITKRSPSNINSEKFFIDRYCMCCGKMFLVNFIRDNKNHLCSTECKKRYKRENHFGISDAQLVEYIRTTTLKEYSYRCSINNIPKKILKMDVDDIYKIIYKSFTYDSVFIYYDPINEIYCNIISYLGHNINATLKFLILNNILSIYDYKDAMEQCSVCDKEYTNTVTYRVDPSGAFTHKNNTKYKYCSSECYKKFLQSGKKHTRYEYLDSTKITQSISIKSKILSGEFTPNATNSWCHSVIPFNGHNFRSSWELMFYVYATTLGHTLEFEKIRIQYFDTATSSYRIYVTDFFMDGSVIVEVKPSSMINKNVDKIEALKKYCATNNYTYIICDEIFLKNILTPEMINDIIYSELDKKIIDRVKKFCKTMMIEYN
jgi:hypothetical protein